MSLRTKILAVMAVPFVVLVAATLALVISRQRTSQSLAAERYGAALNVGYERVVADMNEAEAGMRGYLLTGQARFLEPYARASLALPDDIRTLVELTKDNPRESDQVAKLENLLSQRSISLVALRPFAPITDLADPTAVVDVLVDGKVILDQVREISAEERAQSLRDSTDRRRSLDAVRNVAFAIGIVGMPLGVLASLLVVLLFVQRLAGRIVRTEEIARMMEEGMPLREPSTSDDELGRLERVLVQSGTRVGELQAELRRMGTTDALTRLTNRRGFLPTAEHQLRIAKRTQKPIALMFLDLDGLKHVNDTLGHSAGDSMITEGAFVLRETFRSSDLIARMGGDEFCVLFAAETYDMAKVALARLKNAVDHANAQEGRPFVLSFSAGVAMFDPEDPRTLDELIVLADEQMYVRKRAKNLKVVAAAAAS
ncbi:MAG: diguanylate cyclase [Actinomycetota bacterium]